MLFLPLHAIVHFHLYPYERMKSYLILQKTTNILRNRYYKTFEHILTENINELLIETMLKIFHKHNKKSKTKDNTNIHEFLF